MRIVSAEARGEAVVSFLQQLRVFSPSDMAEYLGLRKVERYRIVVYPGVVVFRLPERRRGVMHDVVNWRGSAVWLVEPIRWWQRGRRIIDLGSATDVVG